MDFKYLFLVSCLIIGGHYSAYSINSQSKDDGEISLCFKKEKSEFEKLFSMPLATCNETGV